MAEHWIPAAKAAALINDRVTLCTRLYAGLVKARAKLVMLGPRKLENAPVPNIFWWAKGYEALVQDWDKGDFSTWLEHKTQLRAFGVSMALSGLLEMLPAERRASIVRDLSVAGHVDWTTARHAYQAACHARGPEAAPLAIYDAGKLGFLTGRAVLAQGSENDGEPWKREDREWDIPPWFWSWLADNGAVDWEQGTAHAQGRPHEGTGFIRLTGVHFLKTSLSAAFPQPALLSSGDNSTASKNLGGRPPVAFAEEMISAIWAKIHVGDLKPARQADIQRAMLEWAAERGYELADSAAKERARRIWQELQKLG